MHGHNTANKTKSKFVVYACSYKVQKKGAIVLPSGGNTPEKNGDRSPLHGITIRKSIKLAIRRP